MPETSFEAVKLSAAALARLNDANAFYGHNRTSACRPRGGPVLRDRKKKHVSLSALRAFEKCGIITSYQAPCRQKSMKMQIRRKLIAQARSTEMFGMARSLWRQILLRIFMWYVSARWRAALDDGIGGRCR